MSKGDEKKYERQNEKVDESSTFQRPITSGPQIEIHLVNSS